MPRPHAPFPYIFLPALIAIACSGGETPSPSLSPSPGSSASPNDGGLVADGAKDLTSCAPNAISIQTAIFKASCDGVGCHGALNPAAGLDLVSATPDRLLGMSSSLCSGWSLVVPGSPEKSFLYQKLVAQQPACGDVMPLGGHLAAASTQCIADWISSMAPANGCETCGGTDCVALASDANHCGTCDNVCPSGVACENGKCSCPSGKQACGTACADLTTDSQHCGACDNACAPNQVCLGGQCASSCGSLTQCGTGCVDTQISTLSCGTCGHACGAGEACVAGVCSCQASRSVSFKNEVATVLASACTAAGCHAGMKPKEGLSLEASKAYSELVNVASSQCGGSRKLVVPGDPSSSYLLQKLLGTGICTGTQMPKAGQSLPQSQLDAISGWICAGAPDN